MRSFPAVGTAAFEGASLPASIVGVPSVSALAGAVLAEVAQAEREVGLAAKVESVGPPDEALAVTIGAIPAVGLVSTGDSEDAGDRSASAGASASTVRVEVTPLEALAAKDLVDAMRELCLRVELRVTGMTHTTVLHSHLVAGRILAKFTMERLPK